MKMKKLPIVIVFISLAMCAFAKLIDTDCQKFKTKTADKKKVTVAQSYDPNEMSGPAGVGEKRYVKAGDWMDYTIYFENATNATAAAINITVTLPKDANLDWSTLELGEVVLGDHTDTGFVDDKTARSIKYALADSGCEIRTAVTETDSDITWNLRIWDPNTADHFPDDFNKGVLPPNDPETHCGEGHISFRVKVKDDAATGSKINASASIVFDDNPAIITDPAWWNTVGSPGAAFAESEVVASEGETATIKVMGGSADAAASVKVYLTYNTAAADLDLAKGEIDGETPKGGLKFPLALSWAKGEVGEKVITIPVKADKAVEDDEFFTLQLADAQGMELGEERICTVTIHDPGCDELAAKIAAGTATKAEQKAWEKLQKAKAPYIRGLADPANAGKVSGGGLCAAGKKVTLKATANKGFVFVGWAKTGNGEQKTGNGERGTGNSFVATTPSLVIDRSAKPAKNTATSTTITGVDESATFYACFITSEEDKASIKLVLNGEEMAAQPESAPYQTNVWAGVYLEWPVAASALSETKVKVAGLPTGLKFTDKPVTSKIGSGKTAVVVTNVLANTIYGAPTAASKIDKKTGAAKPSAVKVTVTTAGKSSQTYQIDTVVDALPTWAQGAFAGGLFDGAHTSSDRLRGSLRSGDTGDRALPCGTVSLAVDAKGKISGKALGDGLTYTLTAPYYIGFEEADGVSNFVAGVTTSWSYKEGTKTVKTNDVVQLVVQDNGVGGVAMGGPLFSSAAQPESAPYHLMAWQYNWKVEPWKTLGKSFDKKTLTYAILPDGSFSEAEDVLTSALGADVTARVTLKFSANGTASVSGEFVTGYDDKKSKYTTVKATGSATLVPVDKEHGTAFIYLTPKGLSPHARCVEVPWPEG